MRDWFARLVRSGSGTTADMSILIRQGMGGWEGGFLANGATTCSTRRSRQARCRRPGCRPGRTETGDAKPSRRQQPSGGGGFVGSLFGIGRRRALADLLSHVSRAGGGCVPSWCVMQAKTAASGARGQQWRVAVRGSAKAADDTVTTNNTATLQQCGSVSFNRPWEVSCRVGSGHHHQ